MYGWSVISTQKIFNRKQKKIWSGTVGWLLERMEQHYKFESNVNIA